MLALSIVVTVIAVLSTAVTFRLISLLPNFEEPTQVSRGNDHPQGPIWIMIVLGSGGHTAEMLALLRDLDISRYTYRTYIVSSGDAFSRQRAQEFEQLIRSRHPDVDGGSHGTILVPRARKVHQSLLSTPWSSLQCLRSCVALLRKPGIIIPPHTYPDIIITNGPATGVIMVLASYTVRLLNRKATKGKLRTVYVESWARVKRLSLSGRILLPLVNRFIVQWEALAKSTGGRAEYLGVLV
ncbi:MAG: hypothetical protein Q9162_005549 [Coniocarpon cinnabarinum]